MSKIIKRKKGLNAEYVVGLDTDVVGPSTSSNIEPNTCLETVGLSRETDDENARNVENEFDLRFCKITYFIAPSNTKFLDYKLNFWKNHPIQPMPTPEKKNFPFTPQKLYYKKLKILI